MSISSFIDFAKDYLAKHPPLHFFTGTQLVLILANGEEFAVREPRTSGTETSGGMEAHTVVPVFGEQGGKRTNPGS